MKDRQAQDHIQHRRLALKLVFVVAGMFGFGFALVPLYDVLCEVTGLNGKTGRVSAEQVEGPDLSREITVKFVANVNNFAPWEFHPNEVSMRVHPGGLYNTSYYARNKTEQPLVGQATPSVAPREASLYFNKTECFCFSKQAFTPHEMRDMPVQFVIDRRIPDTVDTVVLSYTFFDITESK